MDDKIKNITFLTAIMISLLALIFFIFKTEIFVNPIIPVAISLFLIFPYIRKSEFVARLSVLILLLLMLWILSDVGFALIPFGVSFVLAYLFEPLIKYLQKKNVHRWASALSIVMLGIGAVSIIGIFVFPLIYEQLDKAIERVSFLVSGISQDINSESLVAFFAKLGFPEDTVRNTIDSQVIPKVEGLISSIFESLMNLTTAVSGITTQIVNMILIPILTFYFIKDFDKIEILIKKLLRRSKPKTLQNMRRINNIFRKYIVWQVIAATIVGTSCSVLFTIFGIPYPIVLGIICGFLNPIPYLGIFASMIICILTIILVGPEGIIAKIITVALVINALHFINAYFLEPNIAGRQIGLHPVILIASLFVFGGLFGFLGLLVAVPCTAVLIMFFNEWVEKHTLPQTQDF